MRTTIQYIVPLFMALGIFAQERGPFLVTEYKTITSEHEYEMLTMAEFNERYKIVRQEQHVFAQAMREAQIVWVNEGNTISYPRHFVRPELIRKGHYPTKTAAMKRLNKLQETHQERADIRDRNDAAVAANKRRKDPRGQRHTTKADSEDLFKKQRAARRSAETILQDRIEELMAKSNAHNLRGDALFQGFRSKK